MIRFAIKYSANSDTRLALTFGCWMDCLMDSTLCSVIQAKRRKKEEAINAKTLEAEKRMKVTVILQCSLCVCINELRWSILVHCSQIWQAVRWEINNSTDWGSLCLSNSRLFTSLHLDTHSHTDMQSEAATHDNPS